MKIRSHLIKLFGVRKMLTPIPVFGFLKFFLFAPQAYAIQGITFSGGATGINSKILCPIATAMFWVLMSVSVIMVLYGGFLYLTARDNAERISKAHKTLIYAAIGIIVALAAGAIPTVIANLFSVGGVNVCQ